MGDVAEKTGYSREHLSRLLNGGDVDELLVWKISNAVGVDIAAVLDPKNEDDCESRAARLEAELEAAKTTIRELSRALGAMAEKN